MSLRSYVGFNTNRSLLTEAIDPTTTLNVPFGGIFNMSLEDQRFIKNPVYISASTTATSGGANVSSLVVNTPTCSSGDLLLAFLSSGADTGRTYTSSGWTTEKSLTVGLSMSVLSKIATESEPSSHTFTISGGSASTNGIMICIKNWLQYTVGNFEAAANGNTITIPDDSSYEKLIIFYFCNDGANRSWSVNGLSEFQVQLNNTNSPSIDVDAIYRTFPNTSLAYTVTQVGGGTNSDVITLVIK
jgi:hypothetical protein